MPEQEGNLAARREHHFLIWIVAAGSGLALAYQARRRWEHVRPVQALLKLAADRAPSGGAGAAKAIQRAVYDRLSSRMDESATSFLNYGYAPADSSHPHLTLAAEAESDRYCMQLYDHVANGIDLEAAHALEVGCGRGGGAAFLFARHRLASLTGVDFAESSIAHCRSVHHQDGLAFRSGDAEDLPFANESFDAVINIESSHCYPNITRFFSEVERVLRPGGHLLLADLRDAHVSEAASGLESLRSQIEQAGLEIIEEEDITANVVRSLELDSNRRRALVDRYTPKVMRSQALDFAGVVGSNTYARFASGAATYTRFVARKPSTVLTTA